MSMKHARTRRIAVFILLSLLGFAIPGRAAALDLTQLLQSFQNLPSTDQSQLLDSLAGQLSGTSSAQTNTPSATSTSKHQNFKAVIKDEIQAAEQSFLTTMINMLFTTIEQQFMQILGINNSTLTPTPTPAP